MNDLNSEYSENLIEKIGESEIEQLILDYQLESQGYQFFFIIDSFDLISYCFPFVTDFKNYQDNSVPDTIIDSLVAYRYILYNYGPKVILPNEYLSEVDAFRKRIVQDSYKLDDFFEQLKKLINSAVSSISDKTSVETAFIVKKNIKLLTAFMSGRFSKDSINQFNDLLSERIMTSKFEAGLSDDKYLERIFNNTKPTALTNDIYSFFFSRVHNRLNKKDFYQRKSYAVGLLKDSKVIDRIIGLNTKIQSDRKKYVFLYVSSTPLRSPVIFQYLRDKKVLPNIGTVNNYNLLRSKYDIYLRFLIDNFSDSYIERIEFLENLLETAELKTAYFKKNLHKSDHSHVNVLFNMIKVSRDSLDRSLWMNVLKKSDIDMASFPRFKNELAEYLEGFTSSSVKVDFVEVAEKLYRLFKDQDLRVLANSSANLHKITYALNYELPDILSSHNFDNIKFGKDAIVGAFHHFPSLLFYKYTKKNLFKIVSQISHYYSSPTETDFAKFVPEVNSSLELLSDEKVFNTYEVDDVILVKLFLISLVGDGDSSVLGNLNDINIDELLYNSAQDMLSVLETIGYSNLAEIKDGNTEHELFYFLCWISRRQLDYDSSLSFANRGLEKFPDSSRLFHGAGLALTSLVYSSYIVNETKFSNKSRKIYISKAIKNLLKAQEIFSKDLLLDDMREIVGMLIKKNITSIENTLADLYCRKFTYSNNISDLELARGYINSVKVRCKYEILIDYNSLYNYNHTEADIEIQEVKVLINNQSNREEINSKLKEARKRFKILLSSDYPNSLERLITITKLNLDEVEKLIK